MKLFCSFGKIFVTPKRYFTSFEISLLTGEINLIDRITDILKYSTALVYTIGGRYINTPYSLQKISWSQLVWYMSSMYTSRVYSIRYFKCSRLFLHKHKSLMISKYVNVHMFNLHEDLFIEWWEILIPYYTISILNILRSE